MHPYHHLFAGCISLKINSDSEISPTLHRGSHETSWEPRCGIRGNGGLPVNFPIQNAAPEQAKNWRINQLLSG
jgi:hypothetical protein